jgi:DNA polymerase III subunit gamma/tau
MARKKQSAAPAVENAATPALNYTVLARRYRPQQFVDLVGQEPVAQALVSALQSNRVAHAYLFTGARGVGKTSTARILAKALNCEKGPTATPCDACEMCRSIASGEDVDVVEIDGASNRGIDEVREIRQAVHTRPARSRFKIYIIDEVHMLTKEAFNALLKTLEEPPAHVKFIFATTEVQRIPVTILSRCQRFDFVGIGAPRILERLRQIATDEGMQADDEALEFIARRAGGSMRDAQSLLDQLLAFGGGAEKKRLTSEAVHQLLGTAQDERVVKLATAVLERDPKASLEVLDQSLAEGLQLGELLDQLMDYWRDLMIVNCAGAEQRELSIGQRHRQGLIAQAGRLSLDTILAGLDILSATKARLRGNPHGRVLMEMALVRLGRLDDLVALSELAQLLGPEGESKTKIRTPTGATSAHGEGNRNSSQLSPAERTKRPAQKANPGNSTGDSLDRASSAAETPPGGPLTGETLPAIWKEVVSQVGPMFGSNLEKAGLPAIFGPNTLVIRFAAGYNHQRDYCQEATRLARAEEVVRKVTGQQWNLRVETANDALVPPAPSAEADQTLPRSQRQRADALREPLVRQAVEKYGAQIVQVDDGFGAAPVDTVELAGAPADPEES